VVFVPTPAYPIHPYCVIIAGGDLRTIPLVKDRDFFEDLQTAVRQTWPKPKMLILSFPHNPTTQVVELSFFERVVAFAKAHDIMVVHDLAYADLVFDGYQAPSFMQAAGAKDVGVEFFSLSKSYSMAGWRVAFAAGNAKMIAALARMKKLSGLRIFQPVQIAAIIALNEDQSCVEESARATRKGRTPWWMDFEKGGVEDRKPKGTMFVWGDSG
jgi:alanine-synthesizing transaminase